MAKAEYRSAQRSRQRIKTAVADLLAEKPLDKITVSDVVKRAGINRGTFYAHYANIPDVINHLVEDAFYRLKDALTAGSPTLEDIPGIAVRELQTILEEDLEFYRKIISINSSISVQSQLSDIMLDYLMAHEAEYSISGHEEYVFRLRFCIGGLAKLYQDWFQGLLAISLDTLTTKAEELLRSIMK